MENGNEAEDSVKSQKDKNIKDNEERARWAEKV